MTTLMERQLAAIGRRIDGLYTTLADAGRSAAALDRGAGGHAEAQQLKRETEVLLRELTHSSAVLRTAYEESERAVSDYAASVEVRLRVLEQAIEAAARGVAEGAKP